MSNKIEVTREQLENWFETIRHVESTENERHNHSDLLDCIAQMQYLLAFEDKPISRLRADVMALQPAPFRYSRARGMIVDANDARLGYKHGISITQQDEVYELICEALNEYWAKRKV